MNTASAESKMEIDLEPMLRWADVKLQEAENAANSRPERIEAAFDSIYARLTVLARRAGETELAGQPSERVMLLGAIAAGLSACCLDELMGLSRAVEAHRRQLCGHSASLPQALAIGRHLARLAQG